MDRIDGPSLGEIFKPAAWEKMRAEGAKVLQRLLELPLPVVGEQIDAQTALQWGVVSEVVPHERALGRGIEIALYLSLRRRLVQDVPFGMASRA